MSQPNQQVHPEDFDDHKSWIWIDAHYSKSIQDLRLKYGLERPYFSWISQIDARRKYAKKFGPLLMNKWIFPTGLPLEQSSSWATAAFKASLVRTPYSIDLCAGMGVDSYALSTRMGVQKHWANELNEELAQLLKHNLPNVNISNAPAEELMKELEQWKKEHKISAEALTIYVDPDRRANGNKAHSIDDTVPHLPSLQSLWLECAHTLLSKHSPMASLEELKQLQACALIYVVEYQGECKELLCLQQKGHTDPPSIEIIVLASDEKTTSVQHRVETSDHFQLELATNTAKFLIQPGPALSKSEGHVGLLGGIMRAKKMVTGNLYTIDQEPVPSELYVRYEVIEVAKPYKLKTRVEHAAVERIGFPEHPDTIRKKLKVKEGRELKIFALKMGAQKQMILARRLD